MLAVAAAETVAEYRDRVERSGREIRRHRRLLRDVGKDKQQLLVVKEEVPPETQMDWKPRVDLEEPEHSRIKEEEEEVHIKEEADIKAVTVKSEENDEGVPGDCERPEPPGNSGLEDSSETEDSKEDWTETSESPPGLRMVKGKRVAREVGAIAVEEPDLPTYHEGAETSFVLNHQEKPFQCSDCGKRFREKKNLKSHEKIHTGEKPFGCSDCGKSFTLKSHLKSHKKIHTGEKPYGCSACGKSFNQNSHLRRHEKIHSGEKPFSCTRCGKTFNQKSHLRSHEKIHTGEKPFSCPFCGKRFTGKRNQLRHMTFHTGEEPIGSSTDVSFEPQSQVEQDQNQPGTRDLPLDSKTVVLTLNT